MANCVMDDYIIRGGYSEGPLVYVLLVTGLTCTETFAESAAADIALTAAI